MAREYDVQIFKKDLSGTPVFFPPNASKTVEFYSWKSIGGPDQASMTVYGGLFSLWDMIELLRSPVELLGPDAIPVWWGFVNEVSVRVNSIEVGVSLNDMYNYVAIAYNKLTPGAATPGVRSTTAWQIDTDSYLEYGRKEWLQSLSDSTDSQALATALAVLTERKYPLPSVRYSGGQMSLSASIRCKGWWETLGWRYYPQSAGYVGYTATGSGVQAFGNAAATTRTAQSFQLVGSDPWIVDRGRIRIRRQGVPIDNVVMTIHSDSAGAPGSALGSGSLVGNTLNTTQDWTEFTIGSSVMLQPSTTYWIVLTRSGALDATNYYVIDVNEALTYTGGAFRIFNGSSWVLRIPDADAPFELTGIQETTEQMRIASTTCGQFFSGVEVIDSSGVFSSQYRDGDRDGLTIVDELMQAGHSSGRRMLSTVTRDRRLQFFVEPDSSNVQYQLKSDFLLFENDVPIPRWRCPVGFWAELKDVVPATTDMTRMANPGLMFIDQSEYVPRQDELRLTSRGIPSPWDIARSVARISR